MRAREANGGPGDRGMPSRESTAKHRRHGIFFSTGRMKERKKERERIIIQVDEMK